MEEKMKIGPVGKHDARSSTTVNWDEGKHDGFISQIFLSHSLGGIMSIQFQFVLDGKLVLSDRHGPFISNMFDVQIELNYPHEYITGISGEYYKYEASNPHIRSLKFTTNTSEYGPFGTSGSSYEKFAFKLGKSPQFGGFHGTYDASGLQYIGVYLQPKTVQPKIDTEETESKIVLG
ncbi:PREDICTED: protein RESTRICTED TEV MOVEMENT 1-like isoform X1 [Camelina sativa]|uniref:Protein RESTRICTED TEV MOVEMENT 1-like isoform X1 n=1 Tax=Camelina sativa TaxID=90675 RepID=A0ABM0XFL7_CAMSA|nr:PREDICTED: protein RESTRICTED TEV MOVEMENT 1-like isoform X1 [Camelina sativa]